MEKGVGVVYCDGFVGRGVLSTPAELSVVATTADSSEERRAKVVR